MFRNRNPAQPTHSYSPSLDTQLSFNQSSDASVQQLTFTHNLQELTTKSENKVTYLESHPLGDTVLEFGSGRKTKLKNKRYRATNTKVFRQRRPQDSSQGGVEGQQKVGETLTQVQGFSKTYHCSHEIISTQKQNPVGFVQTVKRVDDGSSTQRRKRIPFQSSSSQFHFLGLPKKGNIGADIKMQKNSAQQLLKECFDLASSYEKQGQDIMMARTKAPTKNSNNSLNKGKKETPYNAHHFISLTALKKQRKRRSIEFEEQLSNNKQTNKKIERLCSTEQEHNISTKNKIHLQHSTDHIDFHINDQPNFRHRICHSICSSNSDKENRFHCACLSKHQQVDEQDKLETRIGLRTRIQSVKSHQVFNIAELNQELDLGLKMIDDSFEISAADDSGYLDPWMNISMLNTKSNLESREGKNKMDGIVQEIILDESVVSPECHKLKQQLNSVLASRQQTQTKNRLYEIENEEWIEDNILQKLPVLRVPSFHKSSLMCSSQGLSSSVKQPAVLQISHKDVVVHKTGILMEYVSYSIMFPDQSIGRVGSILGKLIESKQHRNIISVYGYQVRVGDEDRMAEVTVFRQPKLLPHLYSFIHNCCQLMQGTHTPIKISENSFKSIVRDLLWALCYYRSIPGLRILPEDIYLCKDHGTNYVIQVDPINISSCLEPLTPSLANDNITTIVHVIRYLHTLTELSLLNQKMHENLMESLVDLTRVSSTDGREEGNHRIGGEMEGILMHPFLTLASLDVWQQMVNFLY